MTTGLLTTDADLVVRSWDPALERMTGVPAQRAIGRPLAELAPEADARGVLALLADTLRSGAVTVLAPAIHHFLIRCAAADPSSGFEHMQQHVVATPLFNDVATVGLAVSIEDVTARLAAERRLASALRDRDPEVRRRAVEQVEKGAATASGPLGVALADSDWQVRQAAVGALSTQPRAELLQAVVSALRDGHHDFSLLSSALRLLSASGIDASDALIELLRSDDADLRIQAALALGGQSGSGVVVALLDALRDSDRNVRFHAIESLGKLRARSAVEALARIAADEEFFLAFPAIDALVRIGDSRVTARIVGRLGDPTLGDAVAEALGTLGDEDAVAPLLARLDRPDAPVGPIVAALADIHARYDETGGAGGRIEDLTRKRLTPTGAASILASIRERRAGALRPALQVLSWTRAASVAGDLARMLGDTVVPHDVFEILVRFGSPIREVLTGQLRRGDTATRRAAAVALGRLGDRESVPALVEALLDGDAHLLAPVAGALAHLGDARAFEPLLTCLGHPDPGVRQAVIGALNSIGHPDMASRVAELLHDDDPYVRQSAAKIAGYFGYPQSAEALIACGSDADERVRAAALEHIAYLEHPEVVPLLTRALADDTPRCRAAAASALGHREEEVSVTHLRAALGDPDPWVRYFSALSLGRLRDDGALAGLAALADHDPAGHVRIAAIDALGAIGNAAALDALRPLASSDEPDLATAAIRAAGQARLPGALAILERALRSDDPRRRAAAAQGLAGYGADAVEALRWTASADADSTVVSAALAGLAELTTRHGGVVPEAVHAIAAIAADPERRARALPVLVKIPTAAIPALAVPLRSPDAAVREVAIDALARIARPPASSLLAEALDDPEPSVRIRAVEALSRLGARGTTRRIAQLARADASTDVRRAAEAALARTGGADAYAEP